MTTTPPGIRVLIVDDHPTLVWGLERLISARAPHMRVAGTAAVAPAAAAVVVSASGPAARQDFDLDRPLREARDAFEKSYFEFHLAKEYGSMTRVAEKTGLERTHLYRKLKQLGVDLTRNKRGGAGGG